MSQQRLVLVVSSLRTDRDGEVVHYQVGGPGWRFAGDHVKRLTDEPYRLVIGEAPDSWQPQLLTPDARLALVLEPIT